MLGVEWSDWVIRFPTGGGSPEGTFAVILIAVLFIYAIVRAAVSIGDKITPALWSIVTFVFFILVVVAVGRFTEDQPVVDGEVVESDCADELLTRCPPAGG